MSNNNSTDDIQYAVNELHKVIARLLIDISSLSTLAIKLDGTVARAEEEEDNNELSDKELDELEEIQPRVRLTTPIKKRKRGRPRKYVQY